MLFSVQLGLNLPLHKHGPAFVEPEVIKVFDANRISCPRVRNFVGNNIGQGAVSSHTGGGDKGDAGVLHASIAETGRQHQQIVATPLVRTTNLLSEGQLLLSLYTKKSHYIN